MLAATALGLVMSGAPAGAAVTYLGVAALGGTDESGLAGMLEDGVTPASGIGALSAIAWTGHGNTYLVMPDRGPNLEPYDGGATVDNTRSFINRVHTAEVKVANKAGHGWRVSARLTGTTLLSNATPLTGSTTGNPERRYFTGLSSGIDAVEPTQSMRLDSEAVRLGRDGERFYVADEYGPFIYEFSLRNGERLRSIRMPAGFLPRRAAATGASELAGNTSGRVPNRGMEGLAITPDGATLLGIMQAPLLQDHAVAAGDGAPVVGINSRLLSIDLGHCSAGDVAACPMRQFVYQQFSTATGATGNNEILAVNDHEFLVIERDGLAGDAATKLITLIDVAGATDVAAIPQLPRTGLPPGVAPVAKKVLFDLAAALKQAGQPVGEKYEGLAFGPDLPDGRHLLLVCLDNDFVRDAPSAIHAFAVDRADLPGFQQQAFDQWK